jgi:hypothetical protein
MKKVTKLATALVLTLAASTAAMAGGPGTGQYEWTISFSDTDPNVQTGADFAAFGTLYLWYTGCNTIPAGAGMSAAEFDAAVTGWNLVGFNTANGFLNAGTATALLLAVGGCPTGPVIAGSWTALGTAGKLALKASATNGVVGTVDCDIINPVIWSFPTNMRIAGAISAGQAGPVQDWGNGCNTDPVDSSSWGSVKSLYR